MKTSILSVADHMVTFDIGESASENDTIVRNSHQDDLWFHVKDNSSCHIIARVADQAITRRDRGRIIRYGAYLCKQHTKKVASVTPLPIIYTSIKNVTRSAILGTVSVSDAKVIFV